MNSGREPILTFDKYEVVEAIGSGGMATVYRAKSLGAMGFEKPVAIKVLTQEAAADREIVRMFIDEARLGARLSHPNIASVLDFGEADGRYYLAMEYVEGASLATVVAGRPKGRARLDPDAAAFVCAEVLKALAYAHGLAGPDGRPMAVVHRDVSPHNILVDRSGAVKLCDFGIATGAYRAERTRAGIVKGKAAFMSPEQARGGAVDATSDMYSLGLTLFSLISGVAPFEGSDTAAVRAAAVRGIQPDRIRALSCPDPLKAVLERALAMEPGARFQSGVEFSKALAEITTLDPEKGRASLADAVKGLRAARPQQPAGRKKKQPEPQKAPSPPRAGGTVRGTRNVLLVVGGVVLVALLMALLKLVLPDL